MAGSLPLYVLSGRDRVTNRYQAIILQMYQAQQTVDQLQQTSGRSLLDLYQTTTVGQHYCELKQLWWDAYVYPLLHAFGNASSPPVDAAIALLEVTIPARGLCYARTWLLTRLKRTPSSLAQQHRLHRLALTICTSRGLLL